MHTPRTSRPPPPRPACVPALPDLSALLPNARPAPVHPNPLPLPAGRRHPIDPRPRATQIDNSYAIGRGRVPVIVPVIAGPPEAAKAIKCSVPVWPKSATGARGGSQRTNSQRSTRTAGRLSTGRSVHTPSTPSVTSSHTPHPVVHFVHEACRRRHLFHSGSCSAEYRIDSLFCLSCLPSTSWRYSSSLSCHQLPLLPLASALHSGQPAAAGLLAGVQRAHATQECGSGACGGCGVVG